MSARSMSRDPQLWLWRRFPLWIGLAMVLVIAVNVVMMWQAFSTFPGQPKSNGYDASNAYNGILDKAAQEAGLGWQIAASADADGIITLQLTDRNNLPLEAAHVTATIERPVGPRESAALNFRAVAPGRYVSDAGLGQLEQGAIRGQWDVMVNILREGRTLHQTRRVVVR